MANMRANANEEPYAVRHGYPPLNEFRTDGTGNEQKNLLAGAYPVLFPYGIGCIEGDQERQIGFNEHVRWALEYHDRRFRHHPSFAFVVFNMSQRREMLRTAKLKMRRAAFTRFATLMQTLTVQDFKRAEEEERRNEPLSDARIRFLRMELFSSGRHVIGSDESRVSLRARIWGTSIMYGGPGLFLTVNLNDTHDPVFQVLAGEDIDLNAFNRLHGPDRVQRARNIAKDPYAAAKGFHYIVRTMLRTLLGIDSTGKRVKAEMGILGRLSAYFGVVEAQGRGSLHVHMLLWLQNTPTTQEMQDLLRTTHFREKLSTFLDKNVRAHLDGMASAEDIDAIVRDAEAGYARPPDPDEDDFEERMEADERTLARAQQVHHCKRSTCLNYNKHGQVVCKRRAPFPLAQNTWVDAEGGWGVKRLYGYFNSWVPALMPILRCNHDLKLLTSGRDTRATTWYCTNYSTKKQDRSHNRSALLAETFAFHTKTKDYADDICERGRLLLFRCLKTLNTSRELSGPQVMSYLMGYDDDIASHKYATLYWNAVATSLKKTFPEFGTTQTRL